MEREFTPKGSRIHVRYDLCDPTTKEIWEIKPNTPRQIILGGRQLLKYTLNSNEGYHPGGTLISGIETIPVTDFLSIEVVQEGSLLLYSPKINWKYAPDPLPIISKDMLSIPDEVEYAPLVYAAIGISFALGAYGGLGNGGGFAGSKDPLLIIMR